MRSLRRVDALPLPLSDLPCFLDGGPSLDPCAQTQPETHAGIPLHRKILCESNSLRGHPAILVRNAGCS